MATPSPSGLRSDLRTLPRPVWFLLAGSFVNRFGSFVLPFLALYLTRRGYTPAQAGVALSAYGVGSISAAAAGGVLADHIGRRGTIALSMFSSSAAVLALSQARSLAVIVVLTGVAGLAAESYRPASSALLADLVPAGRRVTAFAAYRLAINAGFAAGPAVAGLVAERSFFGVFVGDAATSAVFGALAITLLPGRPEASAEAPAETRGAVRTILADRVFPVFLAASLVIAIVYFQQEAALPLQVIADGHSTAVYGLLISLNGVAVTAIELPLTAVTRRLPPRPVTRSASCSPGWGSGQRRLPRRRPGSQRPSSYGRSERSCPPRCRQPTSPTSRRRTCAAGTRAPFGMTFGLALIAGPAAGTAVYAVSPGLLWSACVVAGILSAALLLSPAARPPGRYATTASRSTSAA